MNLKWKFFITVIAGIAIVACWQLPLKASVDTGAAAPNFTLPDVDGQEHSLADYQGKYVVLEWVNHDCPFVKKHYGSGNMQQLQSKYTEQGVVWLSINSSAPGQQGYCDGAKAKELTQAKEASPSAVLLDPDGEVGKLYGAKTTPHMYIISPEGNLIYQGAIDDTPSFDPDDIPKSKNYVELALSEAMAGKPVSIPSTKSYGCSVKY